MPQLSLYLDETTYDDLRARANKSHVSLSRYARQLIQGEKKGWPEGFWDLFGSIQDDSFVEPAELDWKLDGPRPAL